MFKEKNHYGLSLIISSFASFFIVSGLSPVRDFKSAHEKSRMKLVDQKFACNRKIISCCRGKDDESELIPGSGSDFEDNDGYRISDASDFGDRLEFCDEFELIPDSGNDFEDNNGYRMSEVSDFSDTLKLYD